MAPAPAARSRRLSHILLIVKDLPASPGKPAR